MKNFNWFKLLFGFVFAWNLAMIPYYFFMTGSVLGGFLSLGIVVWSYFDTNIHKILFKQKWFKVKDNESI